MPVSKTAKASMGKQYKEVHVETTEEAIHAIRVNRAGDLFIGDMSRVDKLLAAYDGLLAEIKGLIKAVENTPLPEEYVNSELKSPEELDVIHARMAEIPAQEEDPGHLEDFNR